MESQRDKALRNLEDLNDHLTEFRTKTKEKFKKVRFEKKKEKNNWEVVYHLQNFLIHFNMIRPLLVVLLSILATILVISKKFLLWVNKFIKKAKT